jgi:cholesterol transport system auxiliary component
MRIFPVVAIMMLAGCAVPRAQAPAAIYDFGLQPTSSTTDSSPQPLSASLLVTAASSAWLDSPAIQYRLAYHDPARSYSYANSRWAAAPATLLNQRIKSRIAAASSDGVVSANDGVRANYALRLELEEFTQVFDTADRSHAVVRLRASVIQRSTRLLLAQHSFSVERAAPTANAAGAVRALTEASDKMIEDLIDWLAKKLPEDTTEVVQEP